MWPLVLSIVFSAGGNLESAQDLFARAQYHQALETLGPSCVTANTVAACEQLRGLILGALGRRSQARAAFERMVVAEPDALLPDYTPQKIERIFKAAKWDVREVMSLKLEDVRHSSLEVERILRSAPDIVAEVVGVIAYVAAPGRPAFEKIDMIPSGDVWVAAWETPGVRPGVARYHLVVELASGVLVPVGSEASPMTMKVSLAGGRALIPGSGPVRSMPLANPEEDEGLTESGGLPDWMFWGLIGGGAAVVIGVVVTIVVLTDDEHGTLKINLTFTD